MGYIYELSIYELSIYELSIYELTIYKLSTYKLSTYKLSIYELTIYELKMYELSNYKLSIYKFFIYYLQYTAILVCLLVKLKYMFSTNNIILVFYRNYCFRITTMVVCHITNSYVYMYILIYSCC